MLNSHNEEAEASQNQWAQLCRSFPLPPEFDMQEYRDSLSNTSEETALAYPLEGGILQPDHQWIPTKSFHYIKGHGVEIHELGCSSRVFSGYLEVNRSGRFSIDLQRGPRLERHRSARVPKMDKTPEVLLRLVKDANNMSQKKRPSSKHGCFSQCKCLVYISYTFLYVCHRVLEVHSSYLFIFEPHQLSELQCFHGSKWL